MLQFARSFYNGFFKTKAAIVGAVGLVYLVLLCLSGGSLLSLCLFWLCVAVYLVLPGVFFYEVLPVAKHLKAPLVLLYGGGFLAVLFCICMRLNWPLLLRIVPPILSVCAIVLLVRRKPAKPVISKQGWMLLLLYSALLLLFTFTSVIKSALPSRAGDVLLSADMLWNIGNANSFLLNFPPIDIRFTDVRLHYHYLTELLESALSFVSGIAAYPIVAFYMQPAMLGALVICLFQFAKQYFPSRAKQLLFCYSLFLFSCASLWDVLLDGQGLFWNSNITHLITNINSQTTAIVFLCIFLSLLFRQGGALHTLVTLSAFVMLCFAKGPLALVVVISLLITVIIGLFTKQTKPQTLILSGLMLLIFGFIYRAMYASGANNLVFSITRTLGKGAFGDLLGSLFVHHHTLWIVAVPLAILLQTFLMMPAQMPFLVRGLANDLRQFGRIPPMRLFSYGCVAGGLLGYFLFDHYSMSQMYFLFTAVFFAFVLAVEHFSFKPSAFRVFALCCAAIAFCTTAFLYVHLMGSGARQLCRNVGLIEKYPYATVVNLDDERAMDYLREETPQDAMFATNRIHAGLAQQDGISNIYSALSGRQAFMEGYSYAVSNMGVSTPVVEERIFVNAALFNPAMRHDLLLQICTERGIDYLVYSAQFDGSYEGLTGFDLVFDSNTVKIYKVC